MKLIFIKYIIKCMIILFLFLFLQFFCPLFISNKGFENEMERKTIYIYGHKNPDSDSIISSIALADYLKKVNNYDNIIPCRIGKINKETKYILNYFKIEPPLLISKISPTNKIILVDHNSFSQSLDFKDANIIGIFDHHNITGLDWNNSTKIMYKAWGSTCTIIYDLYKKKNITMSYQIACLLLSGIISDTLFLKSNSTTKEDIDAFNYLSKFTGIDTMKYGNDLLLAGTNYSDLSEYDIINLDSKAYIVKGHHIQIAIINSVNVNELLSRKKKILEEMIKFNKDNKKELFFFAIIDIIKLDSTIFVCGNLSHTVETAFNITLKNNEAILKGVTSRKKQIYPKIENIINAIF